MTRPFARARRLWQHRGQDRTPHPLSTPAPTAAWFSLVIAGSGLACSREPAAPPPTYAAPLHDGDAVYFVGNSFFAWEDRVLPRWVAAIGEASRPPLRLQVDGDIVPGDLPLGAFLEHDAVAAALASRRHAVFVLQGHELEAVDDRSGFHDAVRAFDGRVRAAGGRTVLFQTWDLRWREFLPALVESYDSIARELSIPVIPCGQVFDDLGATPPPGGNRWWLTASAEHPEGDLHPNAAGMAASADVTFAILTGRDPRGVRFDAVGNDLDATTHDRIAAAAWRRASERLAAPPETTP